MTDVSYGGKRFLLLRNGTARLGFRSKQAAVLLRGDDVTEDWTDQPDPSQTWTPVTSTTETWTDL